MYALKIKEEADKLLAKLSKKNSPLILALNKKIFEIRQNPFHSYKFLRPPLAGYNRVHIEKSFVLIFKISHSLRIVEVFWFAHHDEVYKWRPKNID